MFSFKLNELVFNSGDSIEIEEDSLTILIGPNNCGKSTTLREINARAVGQNQEVVLQGANFSKEGDEGEILNWLSKHYASKDGSGNKAFVTKGTEIQEHVVFREWQQAKMNNLRYFLISHLNTRSRLELATTKNAIRRTNHPEEYIHVLQGDNELAVEVSKEIKQSFNKDIIINWGGQDRVWFNIGSEPKRTKVIDRVHEKYLNELDKLPRLDQEGDGILSFTGCILAVKCGAHPILLIDEPEAFLHPPQAKRLGRILAESAKSHNRQIIVATHSSSIIQGALESSGAVSVCRISRENNVNSASIIQSRDLKDLWSKPLLQSSGAISGIFHKGVVICEGDSDCRFYESVLRQREGQRNVDKLSDLYFIHGGGKGEIATLAKSYRALNIKYVAIVDFDILRTIGEFKKLFEAMGGDYQDISERYISVKANLDDLPAIIDLEKFHEKMDEVLEKISRNRIIAKVDKENISGLLSQSSTWSMAKEFGIRKLEGVDRDDCLALLEECEALGLYIVRNGQLETWWDAGTSDKEKWIVKAVQEIPRSWASFRRASLFMQKIIEHFD